jgi:hypothetical protein
MADTRNCEQCGAVFVPRREHARFCSARCRVAWNRENARDPAADASALDWSITAMGDATARLTAVTGRHRQRAFAAITEAVWWVTIVDATLVRHCPDTYDDTLAARPAPEQRQIEGILGGLRFVRNRMGHYLDPVDFVRPAGPGGPGGAEADGNAGPGDGCVMAWTWKLVPEPSLASLQPRAQAWEMTRYRAYQSWLAGHPVGETFDLSAAFLESVASQATRADDAEPEFTFRPGDRIPAT